MLRPTSEIDGHAIEAADGALGSIKDILFDDASWMVRWVVVDTGALLPGHKVLLPPSALGHGDDSTRRFAVRLTRQQVKNSPSVDLDRPVSRIMETDLYDYYGWSPYWSMGFYMGGYAFAEGPETLASRGSTPREHEAAVEAREKGDPHLRSAREVAGYHIHARDGEIGHVADFLFEDGDWSLRYLIVDTKNWWPGKRVLISPRSINRVDWAARLVHLDVDRKDVKDSPEYDGSRVVDRDYEREFHAHYGRLPALVPV